MRALILALLLVGLGWPFASGQSTTKKPDGPKRFVVAADADVLYCVGTATGRTCRAAADVRSFILADDRECH